MKELDAASAASTPLRSFIVPSDNCFLAPGGMPGRIADFCRKTGQPVPESRGEIYRCISESLALEYDRFILSLERLTGKKFNVINIVGGGIKDKLLMQFTADATGKKVVAGPAEATASGTIVMTLLALGELKTREEARALIARSGGITEYLPENTAAWQDAKARFSKLHERKD